MKRQKTLSIAVDAFYDNFTCAALFQRVRIPGSPKNIVDPRPAHTFWVDEFQRIPSNVDENLRMMDRLQVAELVSPIPTTVAKNEQVDLKKPAGRSPTIVSENKFLVKAIAGGDRDSEREFVERYQSRVYAMLLARIRNPDVAADLLQDVMVEAICALRRSQLREATKLTSFVLGIARKLLMGYFGGAARQPRLIELPDQLPDLRANQSEWEDQLETEAMRAVASLDPLDRTILEWTLVDGMKPGAIATKLNMSSDVVRLRKLRATRKVIDLVRSELAHSWPAKSPEGCIHSDEWRSEHHQAVRSLSKPEHRE